MRILAIETVGTTGSLAALERAQVLAERPLDAARRSAQTLAPGIAELLATVGWQPRDVELVAVASGPGSFTGLRIGVTTAKVFAYAAGAQSIGVNTLAVVAAQAPAIVERFSVVLSAERGELFVADFTRGPDGQLAGQETTRVVVADDWLCSLEPGAIVTGPALSKLRDRLPSGATALDAALWNPTAAAVGQLAWQEYAAGRRDDVFELVPHYFRRTAAEEQWERKQRP